MNQVSRVCASAVASAPDPGTQLPSGPGKRGTASFGHGWENPTGDPPGCRNRFPSQRKEEWLHDVCACDGGPWSINNPVPVKRRKNRCIVGGRNRGFQQGHQGTGEVIKLIMRGGAGPLRHLREAVRGEAAIDGVASDLRWRCFCSERAVYELLGTLKHFCFSSLAFLQPSFL